MGSKKAKPTKILTLDTETYNGLIGDLKKLAIYDGQKVYYGNTFGEVEPVIMNYTNLGYDVHIYIHNMEFDLRKIPEIMKKGNIVWNKSLIINGKVAKVQCKYYCLHDSFKILPMSLSKLSKGFNVEHGKLDLYDAVKEKYGNQYDVMKDGKLSKNDTLVNFLDKCPIDDPLFIEYLGYDVMSLYEVVYTLMNITGLEEKEFVKKVSTASLSRHLFKHGYMGKPFQTDGQEKTDFELLCSYKWQYNLSVEDFIRDSYCGGRTEVFKPRLLTQGFHYDVNSLYPSVMIDGEYPIGKPFFSESDVTAEHYYTCWKEDRKGLGFIQAKVNIPMQHIPPLPVKMGKLCFPCGVVTGVWPYEELEYAERECGVEILEYMAVCHFEKTFKVFHNFVGEFYKMKEKGKQTDNKPLTMLAKLILNVAYGYTGMRRDDKTQLDSIENADKHDDIVFSNHEMGYVEFPADIKSDYIQVQIASYVTSRARLVLLKGLKQIEKDGGNVYYCDTDSIVSDIPMHPDMIHPTDLGKWDLEGKPIKGLFLKPKVYTELLEDETNIKFKGISKETQETLNYEYYEMLYKTLEEQSEDFVVVEKNKLQLRSIMYMKKNDIDFSYYEVRDKKMNVKTVEKRKMFYSENRTEPLYFGSEEEYLNFSFKKVSKEVQFDMGKRY